RLPSSASLRNKPSNASNEDNSADTQSTPVPTSRISSVLGDNASGNSVVTITKNSSGFAASLRRLTAMRTSRMTMVRNGAIPSKLHEERPALLELVGLMRGDDRRAAGRKVRLNPTDDPAPAFGVEIRSRLVEYPESRSAQFQRRERRAAL